MFEDYLNRYTGRYQRKHGRPPAESTLHTKRYYLATIVRVCSVPDEASLGSALSRHADVEHLLDMLAAHLSPGDRSPIVGAPALRAAAGWSAIAERARSGSASRGRSVDGSRCRAMRMAAGRNRSPRHRPVAPGPGLPGRTQVGQAVD